MPNHQQRKQLRDALMSAFPERSLLEQLLYFELEKNLNQITQESNLQTIVFQLIQAAQAQGWLVELVRAARKENPGNLELAAIAQELLSSETSPIVLPKSTNPISLPEASTWQQKILILAANPKNTSRLRLDEELREIEQGLQRAGQRERFEIKPALAVRSRDIHRSILDFNPSIVHFSGHGAGLDGLIFEDETGQAKLLDTLALARLFKLFSNRVKCVVLNACYSEIQAKAIAQHIDYVIGMSQAVGDKAAIEFAVGFYDALGAGESIEFAYELGCTAVQIQGIPEELTPKLFDKKKFDLELITPSPSALEPQFSDGNIAEGNFSFQEQITLARIPVWLSQESFTSTLMLYEGSGDVEAKFFVPSCGFTKELLKVEDRIIHPSKFWSEIRRFQEIDAGSPGTYRRFTVVATGITRDLEPLVNELRRVRNYQYFSQENFTIKDNSFRDYIQIITGLKGTEKDAIFIFDKVIIDIDLNNVKTHVEAIFKQYLVDYLPEYDDLSNKILDNIYNHLVTFIQQCKNQNITRKEIETKLRDKIPSNQQPPLQPLLVYTATEPEDKPDRPALRFDWAAFFGGETRAIAPPQEWNRLLIELQETRSWIEKYRNTKRITLAGNRRLIPCLAIGSVFSAVRGYSIEMEYREEVWPTDAHPTHETPDYPLSHQIVGETGTCLVVSIGIRRDITFEVEANLEKYGLTGIPLLHIRAEQSITSPQHTNVAVGNIKKLIVDNLVRVGGKEIHLFFAGPAHLALFLGHRLDATAPITCYAWVATGQYSKTLQLFSGITK